MTKKRSSTKKDYNKLRKSAYEMFMEQGKQQKDIATTLGLSEQTISKWVNDHGWKAQRTARSVNPRARTENIRTIIEMLSERRLKLFKDIADLETVEKKSKDQYQQLIDLRDEAAGIDDSISKWNKTLANLDKENRISLGVYLDVMDDIFDAMRQSDINLYRTTVDFQEQHIQIITQRLG